MYRPGHSHTLNCCGKERVQATRVAASPDLEFLLGRPGRWFASWAPQSRVAFRLRPEWLCGRAESKNVANASRKPVESVRAFSLSLPPPQQRYPTPAVLIQIISACPPGLDCSPRNHHCCRPVAVSAQLRPVLVVLSSLPACTQRVWCHSEYVLSQSAAYTVLHTLLTQTPSLINLLHCILTTILSGTSLRKSRCSTSPLFPSDELFTKSCQPIQTHSKTLFRHLIRYNQQEDHQTSPTTSDLICSPSVRSLSEIRTRNCY